MQTSQDEMPTVMAEFHHEQVSGKVWTVLPDLSSVLSAVWHFASFSRDELHV